MEKHGWNFKYGRIFCNPSYAVWMACLFHLEAVSLQSVTREDFIVVFPRNTTKGSTCAQLKVTTYKAANRETYVGSYSDNGHIL